MENKGIKICDYLDKVENKFVECFSNKGYYEEPAVLVTSGIDKTVDFIGSKISPLKHYILEKNIPQNGVFLIQNCMKLHSLKHLKDDSFQTYGSCYRGMGTLTTYDLEKVTFDTFDYLLNKKYLGIDPIDVRIRINSDDIDLMNSIKSINGDVLREYNTENVNSYRHIYGLDSQGITGRNFNIAIRKQGTDTFFDCAAIIVMETKQEKLAIDMGIGNSSLALCKFNKDNTVASSRIGDIIEINDISHMKFADSVVAVSTLLYENILSHNSKHYRKKFRQYLHALLYWKEQFGISDKEVLNYINSYIKMEYNSAKQINNEEFDNVLKRIK